jgi:ABC-type Fe3+ transport system permease subunit
VDRGLTLATMVEMEQAMVAAPRRRGEGMMLQKKSSRVRELTDRGDVSCHVIIVIIIVIIIIIIVIIIIIIIIIIIWWRYPGGDGRAWCSRRSPHASGS